MEKIYMESGKKTKRQSFFKRFFNDKGSMTVTVVVALVGIVSLMVFGFNQISYAVGGNNSTLPETFISAQGDPSVMRLIGSTIDGEDGILPILGFYTKEEGIPFFCIEYDITYEVDKEYTSGPEITDQGLIYLMSQLYPNKPFVDADGDELAENVQIWLTQSAIWSYLYEVGAENNTTFVQWNDKVKKVDKLYDSSMNYAITSTNGATLFEEYGINALIAQAKAYRIEPFVTLTVNKKSDTISITNDNKYYQSDLVTVVGATSSPIINSFEGYAVDLSRAPAGTVLVDESGNVYSDVTMMAPTSKFYVRVPVDNVTDENKNMDIAILGYFKMYGANKYVSGNYQKIANVTLMNKSESKPLNIQLNYTPSVPDTGMSTAQTIYFIGLIILLSGVGIIYANAKPEGIH